MKRLYPVLTLFLCPAFSQAVEEIYEPAKSLPLVQDVDIVIVGGSSGAVSAALAAKEQGASVFVIAPRPYLGEDMAGKLRLRQEEGEARSPLHDTMFTVRQNRLPSLPFTYTASEPAAKYHADMGGKKLTDGKWKDAPSDSVQFGKTVTFDIDLGERKKIDKVVIDLFERPWGKNGFKTKSISVRGKNASGTWDAWTVESGRMNNHAETETAFIEVPYRGLYQTLQITATLDPTFPRQLIGEISILPPTKGIPPKVTAETTPLRVKKTLDAALLKAGIPFFTGVQVCDIITDDKGAPSGVVMINRSGRQAVRAKVIIDATERAFAARSAGAKTTPFPAGNYTFSRTIVAGEAPRAEGMRVKELFGLYPSMVTGIRAPKGMPTKIDGRMFVCEMELPMKDGSARSFAEAEQRARDMTFVPTQLEAADTLLFTPPDSIQAKASSEAVWQGVDAVDLRVFQPAGADWVFVLSAMADVSRSAAQELMRPGNLMALGTRIGKAAAESAKRRPPIGKIQLKSDLNAPHKTVSVGENAKSLPSYLCNTTGTVQAEPQALPVLAECDVVVAGAGTGGAPAGIAAARAGAKTIVCEYLNQMGGVQTDGLIGIYYWGNRVGFTTEIDEGVKKTGAVFAQCKPEWYRKQNRIAGAEIWFGTMVSGAVVENNKMTGIIVVTPDGQRGVIRCKVAIDSTGNAELPAMAGVETEFITAAELSVQGVGQTPRNMGASYTNTDIGFLDDTDAADLFFFALRSRLSMAEGIWDQAQVINSRERRRMIGAFYMSPLDVINERTYPDVVVRTRSNFDSHGQTVHDHFFIEDPGHHGMYVNLPYRCFLPKKLDGLLVTGLGISAHRDAMPILRMQPDIQNQGYAAGTAAAMAIQAGVTVRNVDMKALQKHLIEKKILPEEVLTMKDSFPLPQEKFEKAVAALPDKYKGLAVVMLDKMRSLPLLRKAFRNATDTNTKFIYAHVLAMLGENDGEALLIEKVKNSPWDKGWNYRGMGQFNRSVSWIDSYIIALGRCRSKASLPVLIEKANAIDASSEYSHFRAIALALENIGDRSAAPALANILKKKDIAGRAIQMNAEIPVIKRYANAEGDWERTLCLRDLCISRALYRLGDVDGLGEKELKAFANDPRGAYANHAKMVLNN